MDELYRCYNYDGEPGRYLGGYSLPKSLTTKPTQLYSDALLKLDRNTRQQVNDLCHLMTQIDPCHDFGVKHWDPECKKKEDQKDAVCHVERRGAWCKDDVHFTDYEKISKLKRQTIASSDKPSTNTGEDEVPSFCYLCSTLEEHKKHIARKGIRMKAKPKRKPKIEFIAPAPYVKKKAEEVPEVKSVLYKITVRTGDKPKAGTSAKVTIQLKGRKGEMRPQELQKKTSVNHVFRRDSATIFYIKGPSIGQLTRLVVQHDGLEQKHSWYLEEVEVTNMMTQDTYVFVCRGWLSLYMGDNTKTRELKASTREVEEKEFEVLVKTGSKQMAGTEANVFITLYGRQGVGPRTRLFSKSKKCFKRGQTDQFFILTKDLGSLTKIRLEHDKSGAAPYWYVDHVMLVNTEDENEVYHFPCHAWLEQEEGGEGHCFQILHRVKPDEDSAQARKRKAKKESEKEQIKYSVIVKTGNCLQAGTDANVYLLLVGTVGRAREIHLRSETSEFFERNVTDTFKVFGDNVGDLKKIEIRHDDTGLGAGWFLDHIIIKRYLPKSEVKDRLSDKVAELNEMAIAKAEELTGKELEGAVIDKDRRSAMKHKVSAKSKKSRESDEESDDSRKGRKKSKDARKKKKTKLVRVGGREYEITDSERDSSDDRKYKKSRGKYDSDSDLDKKPKRKSSKKYDSDSDDKSKKKRNKSRKYDLDSESDEDEGHRRSSKAKDKKKKKKKSSSSESSSSEDEATLLARSGDGKVPHYDQYIFPCKKWLARDEDDGAIKRILKPKSVTTFYQVTSED